MADNVLNAVVDDFVGHRDRLLRIAGVVIFDGHQLVTLNTAAGVDVFNRLTRAIELHVAPLGHRTRHRADHGDLNILGHRRVRHR